MRLQVKQKADDWQTARAKYRRLQRELHKEMAILMDDVAQRLLKSARRFAPVDTGELKESITVRRFDSQYNNWAILDAPGKYLFVHFGTTPREKGKGYHAPSKDPKKRRFLTKPLKSQMRTVRRKAREIVPRVNDRVRGAK